MHNPVRSLGPTYKQRPCVAFSANGLDKVILEDKLKHRVPIRPYGRNRLRNAFSRARPRDSGVRDARLQTRAGYPVDRELSARARSARRETAQSELREPGNFLNRVN